MSNELTVDLVGDVEIVMTRAFDAPRELVFEAHSKCEHITRWYGQSDSKVSCEMDFRPGGSYRFVEHAADGGEYAFRGEYREIVAPSRLVQTFEFEGMPGHVAVETMTFEEHDGKTTITTRSVFQSKEDRDGMVESGMEHGAAESYNRLEELLRTLADL